MVGYKNQEKNRAKTKALFAVHNIQIDRQIQIYLYIYIYIYTYIYVYNIHIYIYIYIYIYTYYGEGIFLTLCTCFHPETSFVLSLQFCNGNTKGTTVFHNCRLNCQFYYTYENSKNYMHQQRKSCAKLNRGEV